ncbi:ABC transporter permease [Subtercola sp. RTI3]|uniref:ABC transporter permease n=1 Tax=Subtercola sp. RTI3 TaxID=3048639 RepID=UPI002B22D908|nr:ABC transporter permease [Subtercola sp. RTI3]MEA9985701.1 ABC transporter permease [Subtercola sp. RTI3]
MIISPSLTEPPAAQRGRQRSSQRRHRRGHRLARGVSVAEVLAGAVILLLVVAAVAPGLIAPGDPLGINPLQSFQPPSANHLFGTDESGRDIFTRVIHGARASVTIGLTATAIGIGLGLVFGLLAGLGPRWLDFSTTRLLEVLFAFPGLLLALLFIVIYGPGVVTSTIAVGLSTAPGYARLIRSQVRQVRVAPYIEAATVLGHGPASRLVRHLLPNVAGALFVIATLGIGQSIVWAASLSYLGLGAVPPAPEWGAMLSAGRTYISSFWWMTFFPGLFIVLSAATTTLLGRALQQRKRSS